MIRRRFDIEKLVDDAVANNPGEYRSRMAGLLQSMNDWQDASDEKRRDHIGASVIGKQCSRDLWLSWRAASPPEKLSGDKIRLFQQGHMAEAIIIACLQTAGIPVIHQRSGRQIAWETDLMSGAVDGVIKWEGEAMLLECKTSNAKKMSGIEKSGPEQKYLTQAQVNMENLGLKKCMMVFSCRDNSKLIVWQINLDGSAADAAKRRAWATIFADMPPKAGPSTYYACKWCNHTALCHQGAEPLKNCRTCEHFEPLTHRIGRCRMTENLEIKGSGVACDQWELAW